VKEIALYLTDMYIKDFLTYMKLLDDYLKENGLNRSLLHYYTTTIRDENGIVVAKRNLAKMVSKIKNNQIQIVIIYDKNNHHIDKNELEHIKKSTDEYKIPFISLVENSNF
jgi:hypothetical protein